MKKYFTYPVFVVLFLSFIGMMGFGAIVKYNFEGKKEYQFLQKTAMFIVEVPFSLKKMIKNKTFNIDKPDKLQKHKDKKRYEQFIKNERNALLVLPRYDHSLSRSVVDIIDLNNFEVIHTYAHDISEMNNQVKNIKEFPRLKIYHSPIRFLYQHPLLFEDGSLIGLGSSVPLYKIDYCSNLQWINDEEIFHHSLMLDHEGNIWAGGKMNPKSKYVEKYSIQDFKDDSIIKINTDGKILFNKSVTELLIENNIIHNNFAFTASRSGEVDPIHLNDIEPALADTQFWQKGDIFLSIRTQSAIIHYRPSTNKVINYIIGPFAWQHDVDIISDKEISIFNNNRFFVNNEYSEVLIYNFETKKFKKIFNNQLQKENFKTEYQGLSETLKDGSLMVEEQKNGRIILFNNQGKKEWEFVNKDKNGDIGLVKWSRVIEDEIFIKNFKSMLKNKTCLN
tara:strand:+ start:1647 stop:2993 length:1347 start_codon:yes stop_codon:yes gene_type:complete